MEWLSLDMLAHVYYIVVKTYSLQTKGYIHSIYHSGLFYRKSFTHSYQSLITKRGASIESPLFVSGPYLNISKSNRANLFEK